MLRLLKTTLLVALGLFLYSKLMGDTVLFYINERFVTLTLLASVGLILVGASYYLRPEHPQAHQHGELDWLGLLIIAIPAVLGWLVPPQPLGAAALSNREVNVGTLTSIAPPRSNDVTMGIVSGEKNILDWLAEFRQEPDPAAHTGKEATIIGFVYRDERYSADTFMVGRFIVSCCVADAAPVGLVVRWPEANSLPTDQWIEVKGHFEPGNFNGFEMPFLIADSIETIDPPIQPYLYP